MSTSYLTHALPGIGGILKATPDDFLVVEIPAYEPSGNGDHVFITIEKRDLSTLDAARLIARALSIRESDIGIAGMKDRFAVTRQRLSLPSPVTPEAALALCIPNVQVLSARRHENKLRTGHLKGNRFVLRIREVDAEIAAARADEILRCLARAPGVPNWYGEQRFGRFYDNAQRGRAIVLGEGRPVHSGREKRLLVSAYQSELFNRYLAARLVDGVFDRVISGDVLKKNETGGIFETTEPSVDQERLERGELVPTGPMFGHALRSPAPGTAAAEREEWILGEEGLALTDFARVSRLAEGARRPLAVPLADVSVRVASEDVVEIAFSLPRGAYATVVAHEVMKTNAPPQERQCSADAEDAKDADVLEAQ